MELFSFAAWEAHASRYKGCHNGLLSLPYIAVMFEGFQEGCQMDRCTLASRSAVVRRTDVEITDWHAADILCNWRWRWVCLEFGFCFAFILLLQWFLTLLEVLNPTISIHAFIEPFAVGKIKYASWIFFLLLYCSKCLAAEPLNWLTEPLEFDRTRS